jgi:CubicO group peptidase (beta-lactamase class C family)
MVFFSQDSGRFSMEKINRLITILFSLFILVGCAAAPKQPIVIQRGDYRPVKEYLSKFIRQKMQENNVQGLSIALVDDQQVVWAHGFGYADVAKKLPAGPETIYPVGSIGKLFTIIAELQLAEQDKIDIDRPVQAYLPDFSVKTRFPNSGPITPRTIMTHHSGLPSDRIKTMMSRKPAPFTDLVKEIKNEYVAYPPNFVFSYSNLAFRLLGLLVQKVSGQDFSSYMDNSVLQPMGMTSASFIPRPDMEPWLSKGYRDGQETREILLNNLPSPEGSLHASVLDLSRFIRMIFSNGMAGDRRILKPETLAEMLRPQNDHVPLDFDLRIGLGWFLNDLDISNAGPVASHGGALTLFYSQLAVLPEQRLGVVVLANSSAALGVVNKVAEEALRLALEAKTGITQPTMEESEVDRILPWSTLVLKDYVGHYATSIRVYNVTAKGDRLYTRIFGKPVELVPYGNGQFSIRYRLFGFFPIKIGGLKDITFSLIRISGRDALVLHHKEKRYLVGEKIEPPPVSDAWLKRVGEYELIDARNYFPTIEKARLRYQDQLLILDVTMPLLGALGIERLRLAIRPVSDTEAVIAGLGRHMGETIYVIHEGGEERLRYSGCDFRRKPD